MVRVRTIYLLVFVCSVHSCRLFTKRNYQTSDGSVVIKTDYKIDQQKDVMTSSDSTLLSVVVYDKWSNTPCPYMGVEIVNLQSGYTQEDGRYEVLIPSGIYNIRVHNYEKYEIKKAKLLGGTKSTIVVYLGTFIWK